MVAFLLLREIKRSPLACRDRCAAQDYVKRIGKVSISCKDTPGFVVNRLLVPFIGQAVEMAERGDATPQDIDTAMVLGTGHPMGPLHLSDYIGNDTIFNVLHGWERDFPDEPLFKATKRAAWASELAVDVKSQKWASQMFGLGARARNQGDR